jgi:serine protease Do
MLKYFVIGFFGFFGWIFGAAAVDYADIVDKILPAVVTVTAVKKEEASPFEVEKMRQFRELFELFGLNSQQILPFEKDDMARTNISLGSGFFIDKSGVLVTNAHFVANASKIQIQTSEGNDYEAEVLGLDKRSDLAVLRVKAKVTEKGFDFPTVTFGNSELSRIGETAIVIGNPFGIGSTVTAGIISAKSRNLAGAVYGEFIQTDAPINLGNSGGPLFNQNGQVIGINTAIYSPNFGNVGIGFALPSNAAVKIIEILKKGKEIERAWMGVAVSYIDDKVAESLNYKGKNGAFVSKIFKNTPAQKAGIKEMDIITNFDNKPLKNEQDLIKYTALMPVGSKVEVKVWRFGEEKKFTLNLAKLEENSVEEQVKSELKPKSVYGIHVENYENKELKAVKITSITNRAILAQNVLNRGDIIKSVHKKPIESTADFEKALKYYKSQDKKVVLINFVRITPNSTLEAVLPLDISEL